MFQAANVENENGGEDSPTDEGEEKSEKVQGSAVEQMLYSSFVLIGQLRKRSQMLILELVLQARALPMLIAESVVEDMQDST